MIARLTPRPLRGSIAALPSKSQAHRILICAALATGETRVLCGLTGQDVAATVRCLRALGAGIEYDGTAYTVVPIDEPVRDAILDVGESGSTLRFLLPVVCAMGVRATFLLRGRLAQRPMDPLWSELIRHGALLERGENTISTAGLLTGKDFSLAANVSSQFLSGILFALAVLGGGSLRLETELESASYFDMTCDVLEHFGAEIIKEEAFIRLAPGHLHSPGMLAVEGDWSNAAFWLCANRIGGSSLTVTGLDDESRQGDRTAPALIKAICAGNARIDCSQIPDLVPPLAALAAFCPGKTRFTGAARLRLKESDRIESTVNLLNSLGAKAAELPDGLWVEGSDRLPGGAVDACGDHRVAMAAAICAAGCDHPVVIRGAQATEKSYAGFWKDYVNLNGSVTWEEEP